MINLPELKNTGKGHKLNCTCDLCKWASTCNKEYYKWMEYIKMLNKKILNICHEIENLPPSEDQTRISVLASDLFNMTIDQAIKDNCVEVTK